MSGSASSGLAQSVKQRLLNLSVARGETFNVLLMRYGVERLLYRLTRATPVELDGLAFDPALVTARPIREDSVYDGIRLNVMAMLGKARVPLQVDVGFGDSITPAPRVLMFGPLLDLPAPVMRTYPPETVIAEKLEAMLVLGLSNSRMKDYFDLWTLCRTMSFDGILLASAVGETIRRRQTVVPDDIPVGLSGSFGADAMKKAQWAAFLRKMGGTETPDLAAVVERLHEFLVPLIDTVRTGQRAPQRWSPGGPWT